jgi:uncharacterized protein (TIGR00251 family)
MPGPAWRREEDAALVLALHVQPGAKRAEVAGEHGEGTQARLKVRLAAAPVEGKANAELVRFLAEAFGVPRSRVTLLLGETSRSRARRVPDTTRPDWGRQV